MVVIHSQPKQYSTTSLQWQFVFVFIPLFTPWPQYCGKYKYDLCPYLLVPILTTMADHFAFTNSPLKDTKKAAGSRKEMSALEVKEEYITPYANFSRDHLNSPPGSNLEELLEANTTLVTLTESYVAASGKAQYSALCKLLNHLSEKFCGKSFPRRIQTLTNL